MSGPKSAAISVNPVLALRSASGIVGGLAPQIDAAQEQITHLLAIGARLGMAEQLRPLCPPPPAMDDADTRASYLHSLHAACAEIGPLLQAEAARQRDQLDAHAIDADCDLTTASSADGVLVERMLARVASLGPVPANISNIALELANTPAGARADLLATELRARIQAHVDGQRQRSVQDACTIIVNHVLHDLGYQVEEIGSTLFVEGGVVHFRRAAWGDYMVRMRVDAKARSANFNVVRAVSEGNNERSVLDHVAEDRWCSEFPALLKALGAHGVALDVTRHLAPGELPVQLVERDRLPHFADTDINDAAHTAQPISRSLP